jgi:hypothetical protein
VNESSVHRRGAGMDYPGAIVIGAGLIAGALILAGQGYSQAPVGQYAIAPDAANGSAWRIDTTTGAIVRCTFNSNVGKVQCTQPAQ